LGIVFWNVVHVLPRFYKFPVVSSYISNRNKGFSKKYLFENKNVYAKYIKYIKPTDIVWFVVRL
tara:strand:+ start:38 stop:229 length:192 start_codon:yes stop_codon:yes gene_type:complete